MAAHAAFRQELLRGVPGILTCEMRVVLDPAAAEGDDEGDEGDDDALRVRVPVPIFEMALGRAATESYGLACAKRVSVPAGVVRRAAQIRAMLLAGDTPDLAPRFQPGPSWNLTRSAG